MSQIHKVYPENIRKILLREKIDILARIYGVDIDLEHDVIERHISRAYLLDQLKQIQRALDRFKSGKYGMCDLCNNHINPDRLISLPSATMCIKCKVVNEKRN